MHHLLTSTSEQQAIEQSGKPYHVNPTSCLQVRDLLTSTSEQQAIKQSGQSSNPTLKADAVPVDAVVSTIG